MGKDMETEATKEAPAESEETRKHVLKSKKLEITASDDNDIWNADWIITLLDEEKTEIGKASFAGEKVLGAIPVFLEIKKEYRDQGYGKEALNMLTSWLFHFDNVYEIKAEADRENDAAVRVLDSAGFVRRGSSHGRWDAYSLTKPKTAWTGLYLFIGIFIGFILGIVLAHVVTGMIIGVVIGVSIGLTLDVKANKKREQITGKQYK